MGSLLRTFLTIFILGTLIYGLLFVVMGLPHPRWMNDMVKEMTGKDLPNTPSGPDYTYDPEEGKVYKH